MLVYVDLEHEQLQRVDPDLWQQSRADLLREKYRLERLASRPCLIFRYDRVTPERLQAVGAEAVFISGCKLGYDYYPAESLAGLRRLYQEWTRPLLGFCGGMQLLAQAHGAAIGPLAPIPPGVAGLHLATVENISGVAQEIGFQPVTVAQAHALFHGLADPPVFYQAHYWEVKAAPPGFDVLAQSDRCPVQAIAHRQRPLMGVQFHPEKYDDQYGDGRQLLQNFLHLAGIIH